MKFPEIRSRRFAAMVTTLVAALLLGASTSGIAQGSTGNYKIGARDMISVTVFRQADLSSQYRVSADGTISMPLIGAVKLAGKSGAAAAAEIRRKLLDGYLVNPQVTVRILDYAKSRFTVLGQVDSPGALTTTGDESLTLLQAVGLAGGFTRLANQRKVTVKRRVGNEIHVLTFDAKAMARDGKDVAYRVRDGDIITVSESRF